MEAAAGLAISAIALASLFTDCIECLDLIELAYSSERGLKTQVCKINILKRQFMVWGESIGLLSPDEGRDNILDQVEGHKEIKDAMQQISIILKDVENLKTKYGVEIDSTNNERQSCHVEDSERKRKILTYPIVDFMSRLTKHQRKHTIASKTRWAVRDSKKFAALVEDLDFFVNKLLMISISRGTSVRRALAIREEVESIVDLSCLSIMEQTCTGPSRSWAAAAKIQSEYLSSNGSAAKREEHIRDWAAQIQNCGIDGQSVDVNERGNIRKRSPSLPPSRSELGLIRPASPPLRAPRPNAPHPLTQVYIFCCQELHSQRDTKEGLLSENKLKNLVEAMADYSKIPRMRVYHNTCQKVMQPIIETSSFRTKYTCDYVEYRDISMEDMPRAKIHVFCPPLLEYIYIALAIAPPDEGLRTCGFQVVIHPDHRLLDGKLYSAEEARESLLQLYNFVYSNAEGEPIDEIVLPKEYKRRLRFLAARFDQVWMDQCVMAISMDEDPRGPINFSELFSKSEVDGLVASIIVMAGPQVCDNITSTEPLAGSEYPIQQSQIYKLEELGGAGNSWPIRWKTRHFCRIDPPSS